MRSADVAVCYGKIAALKDVTLTVDEGEIVALIGANGAGKTTTLKTISGLRPGRRARSCSRARTSAGCPATSGSPPGSAQAPEGRGVFPGMTVQENLQMGASPASGQRAKELDEVYELFPRLAERHEPVRRHAVRRRAADARHRPGADGQAAGCCCSTSRRWGWRR